MPSSIVVIGKLNEYLTYYNLINQEIIKGNIIVSAAILHDTKVSTIDGILYYLEKFINVTRNEGFTVAVKNSCNTIRRKIRKNIK